MLPVSFAQHVHFLPEVLFRTVGDEAVLLNLKTEKYLGLDPVGTRIWEVLERSPTIQAAYDELAGEYAVEPERLRIDLEGFIGQIVDQGLAELTQAAAA